MGKYQMATIVQNPQPLPK